MFRGYWGGWATTIAVGILAIGIWTYVVWIISAQQEYHSNYAKYDARYATEDASKIIHEVCLTEPRLEVAIECVERIANPEREYRQTAQDLQAQKSMAQWAIIMTVIAGVQAVIALGGTIMLVRTLRQGMEANEIMRLEQRPWLTLRRTIRCDFSFIEMPQSNELDRRHAYKANLSWRFDIENVGRSPAFGMKITQKIVKKSIFEVDDELIAIIEAINFEQELQSNHTIFPGEKIDQSSFIGGFVPDERSESDDFCLLFVVAYTSQDRRIKGVEGRVFSIDFKQSVYGPWNAKLLEYARAQITR